MLASETALPLLVETGTAIHCQSRSPTYSVLCPRPEPPCTGLRRQSLAKVPEQFFCFVNPLHDVRVSFQLRQRCPRCLFYSVHCNVKLVDEPSTMASLCRSYPKHGRLDTPVVTKKVIFGNRVTKDCSKLP